MISGTTPTAENIFKKRKNSLYDKPNKKQLERALHFQLTELDRWLQLPILTAQELLQQQPTLH